MSDLTAQNVLRFAFANREESIERTLEMERKLHALLPFGSKGADLLRQIYESVQNRDMAKILKRATERDVHFGEDLCSESDEESEIAKTMSTFDRADRNLIREAAMQVRNIAEVASNAGYKTLGLDSDARAENKASPEDRPGPPDADVLPGA